MHFKGPARVVRLECALQEWMRWAEHSQVLAPIEGEPDGDGRSGDDDDERDDRDRSGEARVGRSSAGTERLREADADDSTEGHACVGTGRRRRNQHAR
jgi:hypothetical protein